MKKFSELSDDEKSIFTDFIVNITDNMLYCTRSKTAWSIGTMSEFDFVEVSNDNRYIKELTEELYNFIINTLNNEKIFASLLRKYKINSLYE